MFARLLKLAVKCPRCRRPPPLRISPLEKQLHAMVHPDTICQTHQCQCGETYAIPADAYQNAA